MAADYIDTPKRLRRLSNTVTQTGKTVSNHPIFKEIFNSAVMSKISISIYLNSWACKEYLGLDYIAHHSKNLKKSGKGCLFITTKAEKNKLNTSFTLKLPNMENYILMDDNRTICHLEPTEVKSIDSDERVNIMKVTFIGKNAYRYMHKFTSVIRKNYTIHIMPKKDCGTIFITRVTEDKISVINYALCGFDDVILKDKDNLIIKPLNSFFEARELYDQYKVTYKLGILLYGIPGTGKSTITRAIMNAAFNNFYVRGYLFNLNTTSKALMCQIDYVISNINNSVTQSNTPELNIIILEEIDSVFPKVRDESTPEQLEKINMLLQFLDGPLTPNNTIFIATTNRMDKLDEAITRDGRFNIQINMDNFDKDEAIEMCNKYDVDINDIIDIKDEDRIRPATLQKLIFNYIMDTKVLHKENKN